MSPPGLIEILAQVNADEIAKANGRKGFNCDRDGELRCHASF